nr:hypothetical protein [Tanacetum cinerariifolium]
MHNNIMASGLRDRPPMPATGIYAQWQLRFIRYIYTRPNGDALRKCLLQGPYKLSTVIVLEKEAIHLLLTGIEDEIYSTVDACKTAHEMMWSELSETINLLKPTIFVSHIRQFWSTARIKTTDAGIHILATVDGIQRTVSESSLRRNLKLRDEDGIVSIPDTELFENLTLMGYNISQNQKLTFQKGQFFHQWKYLIHTIMQCLSPKRLFPFYTIIVHHGEGSGTPSEPHHTPFLEVETSHPTTSLIPLPSIPTAPIPPVTQPVTTPIIQYSRRAKIAQSSALITVADEHASP